MQASAETTPPENATIDLGRSFTYIVEDPRWPYKLGITALFGAASTVLVLVPLLMIGLRLLPPEMAAVIAEFYPGLVQLAYGSAQTSYGLLAVPLVAGALLGALLLGYYIELVRRVRRAEEHPLPAWSHFGSLFTDGVQMMLAYAGYLASNLALFFGGIYLLQATTRDIALLLSVYCCLLPLVVGWGLAIVFLTSICVLPFSESRNIADFYNIPWVLRRLRTDSRLTGRWFLYGVVANFGIGAVQSVPVIGILVSLSLSIPVQAHLLGQYGAALDTSPD